MNPLKVESDRGYTISTRVQDEQGELSATSFTIDANSFMSEVKNFIDGYPDNDHVKLEDVVERAVESLNKGNNPFNVYQEVNVDNHLVFAFDVEDSAAREQISTILERAIDDYCNEIRDQAIFKMNFDEDSDDLEFNFNAEVNYMTLSSATNFSYSYHHDSIPVHVKPGEILTVVFDTETAENELDTILDGVETDKTGQSIMQAISEADQPNLSVFYDEEQKELTVSFKSDLKAAVGTKSVIANIESKVTQSLTKDLSGADKALSKHLAQIVMRDGLEL